MTERYGWDQTPTPDLGLDISKAPSDIQKLYKWVIEKMYGEDVASAYGQGLIAAGIIAKNAEAMSLFTSGKMDTLDQFVRDTLIELTNKDIISAPEIIMARNGEATLTDRLDRDYNGLDTRVQGVESLSGDLTALTQRVKDDVLNVTDFINVIPANYYDSKTGKWYAEATYTGYQGSMPADTTNLYYDPDTYNYYSGATFSREANDIGPTINTLIALANTSASPIIYFPRGNYLINTRIDLIYSQVTLRGTGHKSRLVAGDSLGEHMFYTKTPEERVYEHRNLANIILEDLSLFGNAVSSYGIWGRQMTRGVTFNRCKIYGFSVAQIHLEYSWSFSITNCIINGITGQDGTTWVYSGGGISLGDPSTVNIPTIIGCTFQFLYYGLDWKYGIGGVITGCDFENIEQRWLMISGVRGCHVSGNYFEDLRGSGSKYGVQLGWGASNYNASSIVFEGNMFNPSKAGHVKIAIKNMANSRILNNYYSSSTEGFDVSIQTTPALLDNLTYGNEISYRVGEIYGKSGINATLNTLIELPVQV